MTTTLAVQRDSLKTRFTREEYEEYRNRESWVDDDCTSYEEYQEKMVAQVKEWHDASLRKWGPVRREWDAAARKFDAFLERLETVVGANQNPAHSKLPFLYKGLMDLVAMLFDGFPRPQYMSRQGTQDDYTGVLNYIATWELDANEFDTIMYDIGIDAHLFNCGILQLSVDPDQFGPFGHEGRIEVNRVEPRYWYPDPLAKKKGWRHGKYMIFAKPMDLTDVRRMYPMTSRLVKADPRYSFNTKDEIDSSDYEDEYGSTRILQSPANNTGGPKMIGDRDRVLLYECWLHDYTKIFEAEETEQDVLDEDGNPVLDKYGVPETKMDFRVDPDGYVIGRWVPKYPNGRLIVCANNLILHDDVNPYWSKKPPYIFFEARPSRNACSVGDATFLATVENKLNDLYTRMFRSAQGNCEMPMRMDLGAFDAPKKWNNVGSMSELILQVRPNSLVQRVQGYELPQWILSFSNFLKDFFDDLLGVPGVMKGHIAEGAQLSAEALGAVQDQGGAKIRMKSRLIEASIKDLGYQLHWLIRQTYKSNVSYKIMDVLSRQPKIVMWNEQYLDDDYAVVIQSGSSQPGAKAGAYKQAMEMYRENIVDDEVVLDASQLPGRERIIERKRKKQLEEIEAQAFGRGMALQYKERANKSGKSGRKPKE